MNAKYAKRSNDRAYDLLEFNNLRLSIETLWTGLKLDLVTQTPHLRRKCLLSVNSKIN